MSELPSDAKLAEMARALALAWFHRRRMREERKRDRCTRATWYDESTEAEGGYAPPGGQPDVLPCWKDYQETSEGYVIRPTFCDACKRNGARRAEERRLASKIAGILSALSRLGARIDA